MNVKNYIMEQDFKIVIKENGLYILNYDKLINISFDDVKVSLKRKIINIKGTNLLIKKLTKDELLITGEINNVEFK